MRHSLDAVVLELVRSHPHHACVLGSLAVVCRHDINVPFIVAGPGIKPNTVVTHLAANYDLAPTWLQLAGISYNPAYAGGIGAPSGAQQLGIAGGPPFDGKSLVPLLHGEHDRVQPTVVAGCVLTPVALCCRDSGSRHHLAPHLSAAILTRPPLQQRQADFPDSAVVARRHAARGL